jgi:hypothetical protein
MTVTRDSLGYVLCCHGRPMTCLECGDDYAEELDGPAAGARGAVGDRPTGRATPQSSGTPSAIANVAAQRDKLRAALAALVGVDGREDLEQMEVVMRLMAAPAQDKAVTIDAIHALIATLP